MNKLTDGQLYALANIARRGICEPVSVPTCNWLKENGAIRDDGTGDAKRAYEILLGDVFSREETGV